MDPILVIVLSVVVLIVIVVIILLILKGMTGNISLNLDKYDFKPGDEITGAVMMKLKNDVSAKELKVGLIGVKTNTNLSLGKKGVSTGNGSQYIYQFFQPIDGEKTYMKGDREYRFTIKIPSDILSKGTDNPMMQGVANAVNIMQGTIGSKLDWYVISELDVSGFDLNAKQKINISENEDALKSENNTESVEEVQ